MLDGMFIASEQCDDTRLRDLLSEMVPEWSGHRPDGRQTVKLPAENTASGAPDLQVLH
jgi:hypothetical protein